MSSIVLDLQREALDPNASAADLLRKALVVARKLKLREFEDWTTNELDGYKQGSSVPEYRVVRGQVRVHNPYHGWVTMTFQDPEHADAYTKRPCGTSVAGLEHLLRDKAEDAPLVMPFAAETEIELMKAMGPVALRPDLHVSTSTIAAILDTIRNTVLKWALRLEEDGIVGDGLAFSKTEQAQAKAGGYQVLNFYGPVANSQVGHGTITQTQAISTGLAMEDVKSLLEQIRGLAGSIKLDDSASSELTADLATVDAQLASPRPKALIIKQSLASVRTILEGAGGNVVGTLLVELAKMLAI